MAARARGAARGGQTMAIRNIYLKIEEIIDYSPVEPSGHAAANYRRDCMRNPGHEDATIPMSEVDARRLGALIYREYLDPGYLIPKRSEEHTSELQSLRHIVCRPLPGKNQIASQR